MKLLTTLLLAGTLYGASFRFSAMEERWIREAKRQHHEIVVECQDQRCVVSAGGLWIASIEQRDAVAAIKAARKVRTRGKIAR